MIQLTDKIAVTADQFQYIVGRPGKRVRDDVEENTVKNPRYYSTLAGAVKGAVAQTLRDGVAKGEITTLRQFLEEHERVTTKFAKMLEPINI